MIVGLPVRRKEALQHAQLSGLVFLNLKHSTDVVVHGIELLGHCLRLFVLFLKRYISVEAFEIIVLAMLALWSTFVAFGLPLPAGITSLGSSDWLTPLTKSIWAHLMLTVVVGRIHWTRVWASGWRVSIVRWW